MKTAQECKAIAEGFGDQLDAAGCVATDGVQVAFGILIACLIGSVRTREEAYDAWAVITESARNTIAKQFDAVREAATGSARRPENR